jgi:hypothetical protein
LQVSSLSIDFYVNVIAFLGVSLKVKHWNTDTKLTLVMRELDIQDAMETARRYNDNHSIVFLMSSEPSASGHLHFIIPIIFIIDGILSLGICLSQDRYVSTDLVRLRYDVSYGHEITNNSSKILVNDRFLYPKTNISVLLLLY